MPQLLSRMDDLNTLTPSVADILEQGAAPPGGDGSMREMIAQLQEEFAGLETPVKVVNLRPTPSYTLFLLQPEYVGRLGSRRLVTSAELRRSTGQFAEKHKEWRIGFLAQVEDAPDNVGLLIRTDKHRPLSLRRLLIRGAFRDYSSPLSFTLGNTLEQRLIIYDLENTPHLLVVGDGNARQHLMSSLLLTLTLLNTPNEVRILFAGQGNSNELTQLPHRLDKPLTDGEALIEALTQFVNEGQSRLDRFYEEGVNQINAYNTRMRDQGKITLPHMLLVLDSLSDEAFKSTRDSVLPLLRDLLINGAQVGIHIVLTVSNLGEFPQSLKGLFPIEVFMRSSAPELGDKIKNWHTSLQRFVDAFVIDRTINELTAVELCAIAPGELRAAVDYWNSIQRKGESGSLAVNNNSPSIQQASMLAAYLGWISIGAIRDIFGLSEGDAQTLVQALQASGIVENGNSPMLRFVRLADRPQ